MTITLDRANRIAGWMSGPELQFLAETASRKKTIVEAGSFQGKSTRAMADHTTGKIHAVDPWKPMPLTSELTKLSMAVGVDEMTYTLFCNNLAEHIASGRVIPHGMKFVDFWPPNEPDFIFIDALHDYHNVKRDIAHALELMKHGTLAGHDYNPVHWPGVIKAVTQFFGSNVKVTDTIWSIEI